MSDNRTDLPSPSAPNFNQRLRETIQTYLGRQGNPLDRGLTLRDLIETGVLKIREGFQLKPGTGGSVPLEPGDGVVDVYEPDLTPPPTPTGFAVSAAISHVFIEHDAPLYPQGHGHLRTRVYGVTVQAGAPLPVFNDAVEITQFTGTVHAHPSNPATTWRLWIKWETVDGVLSTDPAGGTIGVEAITGQDVSKLVKALTGPGNPFKVVTEQLTLPDGTVVPAGTYTADAFIHNGQITNAKIANLAVDNAKIANLSASKITAGSIAVGQYIQSAGYVAGSSGWRINGDGNAELSNAVVRGTVYATNGEFTGTVKAGTTILGGASTAYATGSGFYAGLDSSVYKWRVGNPTGARIQWNGSGVEIYNASNQLTLSSGGVDWSSVTGTGKPADNATVGATFDVNIGGQITPENVSTYISNVAIKTAHIADAAITTAKVQYLDADLIQTGVLRAGVIDVTKLIGTSSGDTVPGTRTYTVPPGLYTLAITIRGAGGGGAGGYPGYATQTYSSGGNLYKGADGDPGARGGLYRIVLSVTPGQVISYTVGSGGAGGPGGNSPGPGAAGTQSSVTVAGVTYVAGGGSGGNNSAAEVPGSGGGTGGAGLGALGGNGGTGGGQNGSWSGSWGSFYLAPPGPGSAGQNGAVLFEAYQTNGLVSRSEWENLMNHMNSRLTSWSWP